MFLSAKKLKKPLWIHLKVNKGKIHRSSFPQFIVVEHLKVLFWRDAQTRNISLRVRFDLVIEFYGLFTHCAVHPNHLQRLTARRAHTKYERVHFHPKVFPSVIASAIGWKKQDSRPGRSREVSCCIFSLLLRKCGENFSLSTEVAAKAQCCWFLFVFILYSDRLLS